jgi:hypothetical protein
MTAISSRFKFIVLFLMAFYLILFFAQSLNGSQLEPDVVSESCFPDPSFTTDGHLYSTYLVARYEGINQIDAYTLAYYSEYPDIDGNFKATSAFIFSPHWRSDVRKVLHSLHGGDLDAIEVRRKALKMALSDSLNQAPPNYWQAGLIVHAFGDAYSHTTKELGDPNQEAYGSIICHLHHWKTPDQIARRKVFPKYREFIEQLYNVIDVEGGADSGLLTEFLNTIEGLACKNGCEREDIELVEQAIFDASFDDGTFYKKWYDGFKKGARHFRTQYVKRLIDSIKKYEQDIQNN